MISNYKSLSGWYQLLAVSNNVWLKVILKHLDSNSTTSMFDFCQTSGLTVCCACRTNLSHGYVAGSAQQVAVALALAAHLPLASVLTSASPWPARGRTQGEPPL